MKSDINCGGDGELFSDINWGGDGELPSSQASIGDGMGSCHEVRHQLGRGWGVAIKSDINLGGNGELLTLRMI